MLWIAVVFGIVLVLIFPKQIGIIVGVIVLILVLIVVRINSVEKERYKAALEARKSRHAAELIIQKRKDAAKIVSRRERDAVTIDVILNSKKCSEDYPILIKITNRSNRIINKTSWNLQARLRDIAISS